MATSEADDDPALTLWRQLSRPKAAAVAAAAVAAEDSEVGPPADDSEDTDAGPRPPWKGIFGRRGNVRPTYNPDLESFFYRRRELFSKFDRGVRMDAECWYSVTPERLAAHIAVRMCKARRGLLVVDPFCGCGGNVIQQALADPTGAVLAIDIDPTKVSIDLHPLRPLPPPRHLHPLRPLCPLHPSAPPSPSAPSVPSASSVPPSLPADRHGAAQRAVVRRGASDPLCVG